MVVPRLNIRDHDRRMASTRSFHDRTDADLYSSYEEENHGEYGAPYTPHEYRAQSRHQAPSQNRYEGHAQTHDAEQQRARATSDDVRTLGFWHDQFPSETENEEASAPQEWEERQSPMTYALAIAILVVLSASGWFLYRWISPTQLTSDIPVIYPEEGPYKIRPENPGGMVIPHQDKLVYGRLSPRSEDTETVEHLLPPPEEPMEYGGSPEGEASDLLGAAYTGVDQEMDSRAPYLYRSDGEQGQTLQQQEAIYVPGAHNDKRQPKGASNRMNPMPVQSEPTPQRRPHPIPQPQSISQPQDTSDALDFSDITRLIEEQAESTESERPALSPFPSARVEASVNRSSNAKTSSASMPDSGTYVVQIATVPSFEAGEKEWQRMKKAAASALKGKGMMLEKSGKAYRLVVGPFATMTQARQLAEKLEAFKIKGVVMSVGHE